MSFSCGHGTLTLSGGTAGQFSVSIDVLGATSETAFRGWRRQASARSRRSVGQHLRSHPHDRDHERRRAGGRVQGKKTVTDRPPGRPTFVAAWPGPRQSTSARSAASPPPSGAASARAAAPGTRSSRSACSRPRGPRAGRAGAAGSTPRALRCACSPTSARAPWSGCPPGPGSSTGCSGAARPGVAGAARRGPGDRQVHAHQHGPGQPRAGGPLHPLRLRRGVGRAGTAARRAPRRRRRTRERAGGTGARRDGARAGARGAARNAARRRA